jgi:hypothetical protein
VGLGLRHVYSWARNVQRCNGVGRCDSLNVGLGSLKLFCMVRILRILGNCMLHWDGG